LEPQSETLEYNKPKADIIQEKTLYKIDPQNYLNKETTYMSGGIHHKSYF